jgi:hypothetical protein
MSTGVSCTVYVDGVRAADGSPGEAPDAPAILENLSVAWGRSDTMSQPAPDVCTFSVSDPVGGNAFTGIYRTGSRIDVTARGGSTARPSAPTFIDGGFETGAVSWAAIGGSAARTQRRASSGAYSLQGSPGGNPMTILLGPGAFQPAGTNPSAWDALPTTEPGQVWRFSVSLWLPVGAVAAVRPELYSGPYSASGVAFGSPVTLVGNGAWQSITGEAIPGVADRWLGMAIALNPIGSTWDGMPSTLTWNGLDPSLTWDDMGSMFIDDAQVFTPATEATRGVLVFSGRITDMSASWDDTAGGPVVEVTAGGFTADLENRRVGDQPWAVESVAARAQRILNLAGLPITIDIDSSVSAILLSWRDVDSQGATGLLQEIATSVDGVLWPAVHQTIGAYLKLEDPSLRAALLQLATNANGTIIITQSNPDEGFDLSACVIFRDPVTWVQDVSDVTTRASVQWKVQGVDNEGLPTTSDATELVVNPSRESLYGTRGVSVSTQLQAAVDAQNVAQRILSRATPSGWRASGLAIDDDDVTSEPAGISLMLDLLDGTSRIGAPIVIGDLPVWSPSGAEVGVYLEGGTYRYIGGRWVLELIVSVATGLGVSASWDALDPSWTWNQWDPGITWNDLRGVAP